MIPRKTIIYSTCQQDSDLGVVFANWCEMDYGEEVIETNASDNSALFAFFAAHMATNLHLQFFPVTIICCNQSLITPRFKSFITSNVVGFVDAAEMWSKIEMPECRLPLCRNGDIDMPIPWSDDGQSSLCPFVYDIWGQDERVGYARQCRFDGIAVACPHKEEYKGDYDYYNNIKGLARCLNYVKVAIHFFDKRRSYAQAIKISKGMVPASISVAKYKNSVYQKMVELLDAADHVLTFAEIADLLNESSGFTYTTQISETHWDWIRVSQLVGKDDLDVREDWNLRKATKAAALKKS